MQPGCTLSKGTLEWYTVSFSCISCPTRASIATMYTLVGFVFPTLMALAAMCDLLTMKIPNWLTATLAIAFLPVALVVGLSWSEILLHISAGLLLLVIGVGMFAARWMGGG